jgi:hypothetical protein
VFLKLPPEREKQRQRTKVFFLIHRGEKNISVTCFYKYFDNFFNDVKKRDFWKNFNCKNKNEKSRGLDLKVSR